METNTKDTALRQALRQQATNAKLPSNFAYTTLRRIHREQWAAERRQQLLTVALAIVVALSGIGTLLYYYGASLYQSLVAMLHSPDTVSLGLPTLFCLLFFALLNHYLQRRYRNLGAD